MVEGRHSLDPLEDLTTDVAHRSQHTLAAEAGGVAVPEFHGLVAAGALAGGYHRPTRRPIFKPDLDFKSRLAPGVEHFPGRETGYSRHPAVASRARRASAAAIALSTASTGSEALTIELSGSPFRERSQVWSPTTVRASGWPRAWPISESVPNAPSMANTAEAGLDDDRVPRIPDARDDWDVNPGIRLVAVFPRQDADGRAAGLLGALAHGCHYTAESAAHYGRAALGEFAAHGLGESAGLLITGVPADYGYGDEFIGCSWHTAGFSLHALKSVRAAQLAVPSDHTIAEERAFAASDGAISVRWVTMKATLNFHLQRYVLKAVLVMSVAAFLVLIACQPDGRTAEPSIQQYCRAACSEYRRADRLQYRRASRLKVQPSQPFTAPAR